MTGLKPYQGIRIVDLSQGIAAPMAAAMMARYGAEVIKVEPMDGEWGRKLGQIYGDQTAISMVGNFGKKSIALNLKDDAAKTIVQRLTADADIFMEAFRPGVIDRLGLDYQSLSAVNPGLIYLSVSAFGQDGPFAERPGTDNVMQAFSGFMTANRDAEGTPVRCGLVIADLNTALYSLQVLQAALFQRVQTGKGCYLDNSLLRATAAFTNINSIRDHLEGDDAKPFAFPGGTFKIKDGYMNAGVLFERLWVGFARGLGLDDLADDPGLRSVEGRLARADEVLARVRAAFAEHDFAHWHRVLKAADVVHERVNGFGDFLAHPHTQAVDAVTWLEQPGVGRVPVANFPGAVRLDEDSDVHAPGLSEHAEEILRSLDYSDTDIAAMAARGVVKLAG